MTLALLLDGAYKKDTHSKGLRRNGLRGCYPHLRFTLYYSRLVLYRGKFPSRFFYLAVSPRFFFFSLLSICCKSGKK